MNNDLISRESLEKSMRKSINERYKHWDKPITVADIATLIFDEIDNAPPVEARPQGDCISREALKEHKVYSEERHEYVVPVYNIDNAQAVDLWQMRQEATENALKKAREEDKWGKWVITEIRCPNCLEYFDTDCHSTEELKKCPSCGAEMRGGAE